VQYSATHAGARDEAVARVLSSYCTAWQRELPQNVCSAGVVSRQEADAARAAGPNNGH
jgi:hypothetical protein